MSKSSVVIALSLTVCMAAVKAIAAGKGVSVKPTKRITYKKIGDNELRLHVFEPVGKTEKPMPAILFFFGGGWNAGAPDQFYHHANYFAKHGMLAIAADYRTKSNGGVQPSECIKDGKAAVRYVREHASELGVDPDRIAAGGGSAGGHVAAATGTVAGYEHPNEDLSISSIPNALVLFNPVYDNSKAGYGYEHVKEYWGYRGQPLTLNFTVLE